MRPVKVEAGAVADGLVSVFRRDGYAGASLRDLATATGLKSASLYHRFIAGKPDMALAALDRAAERFAAKVIAPLGEYGPAPQRLRASAQGLIDYYCGGEEVCLLAVMALSDAPAPVRARVAAMLAGWRDALAATLDDARILRAREVAEDRIAAIQGALIIRRGGLGASAFTRAVVEMGRAG